MRSSNHSLSRSLFLFLLVYFWLLCVFIAGFRLPLLAASRGYSLVAMHGLLIVVASLVAEHGL